MNAIVFGVRNATNKKLVSTLLNHNVNVIVADNCRDSLKKTCNELSKTEDKKFRTEYIDIHNQKKIKMALDNIYTCPDIVFQCIDMEKDSYKDAAMFTKCVRSKMSKNDIQSNIYNIVSNDNFKKSNKMMKHYNLLTRLDYFNISDKGYTPARKIATDAIDSILRNVNESMFVYRVD